MQGYISLIVGVIGLIAYFVSKNAKVSEAGRILFFTGLLAFLLIVGGHSIVIVK